MTLPHTFGMGQRVVLRSFQGLPSAERTPREGENYWLLVGRSGAVCVTDDTPMRDVPGGPRVMVRFDDDVQALGLHCHNEIPNALWIKVSDLVAAD